VLKLGFAQWGGTTTRNDIAISTLSQDYKQATYQHC
jgi:hypothetical protein